MPIRINIDPNKCAARVMGAWEKALLMLTSEIRADCNEYVKRDKGTLEESSMTHSELEKGKIVWATPYAKRQYWEIQTAFKDVHPKATWMWAHVAKKHLVNRWRKQAEKGLRENL